MFAKFDKTPRRNGFKYFLFCISDITEKVIHITEKIIQRRFE